MGARLRPVLSVLSQKSCGIRAPYHPGWRRRSSALAARGARSGAAAAILLAAADPADPTGGASIRTSPWAWGAAAVLILAALYLAIRMVEWDLMNEETPNQEDPFSE